MTSLASPYFWGAKVLIVEGDRKTREAIVEGLTSRGFVTFGAESNTEALSFIDQEMDVVAFDISMLNRGGVDLIDEWRIRRFKTKILVCGYRPDSIYLDIRKRGARVCFRPLAHLAELVKAIRQTLERAREEKMKLPPGYTLESAKALMEKGRQENEEGKLTWAADAWRIGSEQWMKEIKRWMNRWGTKI